MTSAGSYDSETVRLLRDILEDAWERLTFEQRARTQKSEVAMAFYDSRGKASVIR
jgi:hypothetical protein